MWWIASEGNLDAETIEMRIRSIRVEWMEKTEFLRVKLWIIVAIFSYFFNILFSW